jgi:hypothetical protein
MNYIPKNGYEPPLKVIKASDFTSNYPQKVILHPQRVMFHPQTVIPNPQRVILGVNVKYLFETTK